MMPSNSKITLIKDIYGRESLLLFFLSKEFIMVITNKYQIKNIDLLLDDIFVVP